VAPIAQPTSIATASKLGGHRSAVLNGYLVRTFILLWQRSTLVDAVIGFPLPAATVARPISKYLRSELLSHPNFLANVRALLTPGVTIVLTEKPVHGRPHSTDGFKILTRLNNQNGLR
jgi:hypothetical protein